MNPRQDPPLHPYRRVVVSGTIGALSIVSLMAGEHLGSLGLEILGIGLVALDVGLGLTSHADSFRHWGRNIRAREEAERARRLLER